MGPLSCRGLRVPLTTVGATGINVLWELLTTEGEGVQQLRTLRNDSDFYGDRRLYDGKGVPRRSRPPRPRTTNVKEVSTGEGVSVSSDIQERGGSFREEREGMDRCILDVLLESGASFVFRPCFRITLYRSQVSSGKGGRRPLDGL